MEEIFETLRPFLPILIPLLIVQLGLVIASWMHIFKHPNYRFGNRWLWLNVTLVIQIIGPLFYFFVGREED